VSRAAPCPRCGRKPGPEAARWKPFCSERCRLGDLGQWFEGRYSIPVDAEPDEPPPEPRPPQ
jgi:uncharacterized protein